jgi:hypothetical protein
MGATLPQALEHLAASVVATAMTGAAELHAYGTLMNRAGSADSPFPAPTPGIRLHNQNATIPRADGWTEIDAADPADIGGTYACDVSKLWGGNGIPDVSEAVQGVTTADCNFWATIDGIIYKSPKLIQYFIVRDGDGVCVYFPPVKMMLRLGNRAPNANPLAGDGGCGPVLLEKAYAWINGGYANISETNPNLTALRFGFHTGSVFAFDPVTFQPLTPLQFAQACAAVLAKGFPGRIDTLGQNFSPLIAQHSYDVVSVDVATGIFTLLNPWNIDNPGTPVNEREVTITAADFMRIAGLMPYVDSVGVR